MLIDTLARSRPAGNPDDPAYAVKISLRRLARRYQALAEEIKDTAEIGPLVTQAAPKLVALPGVGPETAGQLLETAGDNPERLRSEASFAHLCGVSPISASSGRPRHRLNRSGDRQANKALHTIVLVRMKYDLRTQEYVARPKACPKWRSSGPETLRRPRDLPAPTPSQDHRRTTLPHDLTI